MARRNSTHFLPYDDAIQYVQKYNIKSRSHYWDWLKNNKIGFLPKHPHAHYKQHWESWNVFLGTTNSFERSKYKSRNFRPYWEAVRWVQKAAKQYNIKTANQWYELYEKGEVPDNKPKHPDHYYPEFIGRGWKVWLGTTIKGRMMSEVEQLGLVALCTIQAAPQNMIIPVYEKNGIEALREKLITHQYTALRLYKQEENTKDLMEKIFAAHTVKRGMDGSYVVADVNGLFFDTDNVFEMVRPK